MLTINQQKYIKSLPRDKIIHIHPYNPKAKNTAHEIIARISKDIPELKVEFMGATALEIAGQNDIDLHILSTPNEFATHLPTLEKIFGTPSKQSSNLIKWEFVQNDFDVELYLTDRNSPSLKEQEKTFELLMNNPKLKSEYENIKKACDGKSFVEYMTKKYVFFNNILGM